MTTMKRFITGLFLSLCLTATAWADCEIEQGTSGIIKLGPLVLASDFTTAATALTIQKADVRISKNGGNYAAASADQGASDVGAPHDELGDYDVAYNTTDSNTAGNIRFIVKEATALVAWRDCIVRGSTAYENQIESTASIDDLNETDCSTIASTTSPMGRICANLTGSAVRYTVSGTSDSGTTTTVVDTERTEAATNHWVPGLIVFTSGNISGQGRYITGFNASTDTITFTPAVSEAVTTETYEIRAVPASLAPELAVVQADTDDLQSKLGTPAGASLSADVAAVKVDSAAIKTKTDFLPSVTAGANGGVFIAGVNAATTITTGLTTTFTGNLTGTVGSVTGAVGSVAGAVGSVTGAVGSVTGTIGGLTAAALKDFFDTDSTTTYASAAAGSVVKEIVDNAGGSLLTNASIADAVWDEIIAGHAGVGSTGEALSAASSAGDPWATAIPGAYGAGTAGKIVGDNLNATMTSRASQTTLDTLQADADDIQTRLPASLLAGRMDANVGALAANVLTAAAINSDAFTAAKFASDASTEFAATLMATEVEAGLIFKHWFQYGGSALFGKYDSASGTFRFRDLADTKNRIIYSTSSTARTAVTLSPD